MEELKMNCSGYDLRDYFFGELPEGERASAERHVEGCGECAAELEQLRGLRGSLAMLREIEPPQRIGFVSDKVFEPSPLRRWLAGFWQSGARLGFASAAMLSLALLVLAARQPAVIEKPVEVAAAPLVQQVDVKAIVAQALAERDKEQDRKTRALLAASDERHQLEERALALRVSDYTTNVEKRLAATQLSAMNYTAGGQ